MLTGIRTHFYPDPEMANTLSQWIGCARVIYNAKCDEDRYLRTFAKRYMPLGTYPEINAKTSHFKDPELTPWLSDCPSQILRNAATIWQRTYKRFFDGSGGRPRRKTKARGNYLWLTRELFTLEWQGSTCVLHIGTRTRQAGTVRIKWNKSRIPGIPPASIWIKKTAYRWYVSFSYDDGHLEEKIANKDHLAHLRELSESELNDLITPVDRGVAKPLHTHNAIFTLTQREKDKIQQRERRLKRYQRRMARQQQGSNRHKITIRHIAKIHQKTAHVRSNFWHQTTRALVDHSKVIVIEDLKLKNMTRRAKPKQCPDTGQWIRNGASAKSGLNKAMLNVALGQFETFLRYKMERACKPLFKVSAHHTSQECAHCGHIHPNNRKTQSDFVCTSCGHEDNADHNAALVIRKRAIHLILDSGTELAGSHKNVLRPRTGAKSRKTSRAKARGAVSCLSKKTAAVEAA